MLERIPQSFIQDVLARVDIVELIQARLSLVKRGGNYLARCPFHEEKTPSNRFKLSHEQIGNAINFLMSYDRVEFLEALTSLAAQAGMELPQKDQRQREQDGTQAFYGTLEKVAHYYQKELSNSLLAIEYLKSRGVTGATAKYFALGFSPGDWENLLPHFKNDQQIKTQLLTNGLLVQKNQHCYDRFRHRIMFPIRDVRGRVIAFGGRVIGNVQPKYLNSPETPLFHKSDELYGLYEARQKNQSLKRVVMVEGYMDVISLYQHGVSYAVATLGTATNAGHLQKILRYTNEVIFCFDGDTAGRNAAWKALTISMPYLRDGIEIRFLFLPQGEDPDTLIRKIGQNRFEQSLNEAEALSDVFFRQLQQKIPLSSLDSKAHFAKEVSAYLNTMPTGLFRQLFFDRLGQLLSVDPNSLLEMLSAPPKAQPIIPIKIKKKESQVFPPAYLAIALLLQKPDMIAEVGNPDDYGAIEAPGIALLVKMMQVLKKYPALSTTGSLLALFQEPEDRQWIAELAARQLAVSSEGLLLEFRGALERLREQHADGIAQSLIQKAKRGELTSEEKKKLNELLTNPRSTPI